MEISKLMEYFQKKGLTESQQKEVHTQKVKYKYIVTGMSCLFENNNYSQEQEKLGYSL